MRNILINTKSKKGYETLNINKFITNNCFIILLRRLEVLSITNSSEKL